MLVRVRLAVFVGVIVWLVVGVSVCVELIVLVGVTV